MYTLEGSYEYTVRSGAAVAWQKYSNLPELLYDLDFWGYGWHTVTIAGLPPMTLDDWRQQVRIGAAPTGPTLFDLAPYTLPAVPRPCKCGYGASVTDCKEHSPACG